ncbi:MAG: hypothetical protein KAR21_08230 [Spirochaetales bacterium]|nr:hypothetical protein [Spirochaetales bacterium]
MSIRSGSIKHRQLVEDTFRGFSINYFYQYANENFDFLVRPIDKIPNKDYYIYTRRRIVHILFLAGEPIKTKKVAM